MPDLIDFCLPLADAGTVNFAMQPAVSIGGWDIRFELMRRFGSTEPLAVKSCASGYNGVSGITVLSSGLGQLQVRLFPADVSGQVPGNFAYRVLRTTSGAQTELTKGFRICDW